MPAHAAIWGDAMTMKSLLAVLLVLLWPAGAEAAEPVARVVALAGQAVAAPPGAGRARTLAPGAELNEGDSVSTGRESRLKIAFEDGSVLQLGAETTLTIALFAGPRDSRSVLLDAPRGVLRAIVDKLSPGARFEIRANTAVASVRGTDFMAEVKDDVAAVFVVEGVVVVAGPGGFVTLRQGEGTDVPTGAAPRPVVRWGQARIDRLTAATAAP
jgi:hypothetical protein